MAEHKIVKAGLLGFGTVGAGVYKLAKRQKEEMESKTGARFEITRILVRDRNKEREGVDPALLTDQWEEIIMDDEIELIIEVMGGIEPARTRILEALHAGKNVVTANKELSMEGNFWMRLKNMGWISCLRLLWLEEFRLFVR